jgi:tRNA pseudouridine13 synthase
MKTIEFNLKIKEKPEDFIVKEKAFFEEGNNNYLYLLVKRDYNLFDIQKRLNFSFAGIKDKRALTFQYVSFDEFKGKIIYSDNFRENLKKKKNWYFLKFIKKINKKVKPGFLKGNFFWIKTNLNKIQKKEWFINYYDLQRLKDNWQDGLRIIKELKKENIRQIKKNKIKAIKIDSFLSYIWNKSLEKYLINNYEGYFIKEENFYFFIPNEINLSFNYWPIIGYKTKYEDKEIESIVKETIEQFIDYKELIEKLKLLRFKGDYRKIKINISHFKIMKKQSYIHFYLPKGSYATMYLKFLYKN